jgi:hypothetical protein
MVASDELVAIERSGSSFGAVVLPFFPNGINTIPVAIVDTNIIICASNGIYRSTDAGATFTQVSSLICKSNIRAAKIGTDYFIYQSTTSAFRSTDSGVTWTTQAVTNGPDVEGFDNTTSAPGRIVFNGTVYGCLTSTTRLSTTTDGITWTNVASAFANNVNCLVWSGTHWIAGRSDTSPQIYRSTNGASWSTVTARTNNSGQAIGGLATDGAGVIITGPGSANAIIGRSADNGATWADVNTGTIIAQASSASPVLYIGSNFIVSATSTGSYVSYSPTALAGSFIATQASFIYNAADDSYGVNSTHAFYTKNGLRKSTLTIPTTFAGMDVSAAILEVTP